MLLLALFVSTETRMACIHLDYLINKEAIAKTKCEQRDIPESTCDGKCYLRKQIVLIQEDSNDNNPSSPIIPSELRIDRPPAIGRFFLKIMSVCHTQTDKASHFFRESLDGIKLGNPDM